ncbi:MAG: zinc ribbon domain-containing protein [Paramuribaculum sp.]|nr:zinc ribbon domain-containing protein [Paramuribaculum sp.]
MDKNFSRVPLSNGVSRRSHPESMPEYAWRPKKTVKEDVCEECPYCHASIVSGAAICPACGRSLTPDKCSFCGAPKKITAKFCTRCGLSGEGVICPQCGTLNSRNFCRKCNSPLTDMAQKAVAAAQNDPMFKAVQKKADELAELHARIEELRNGAADQPLVELSAEDKSLLKEYADILGMIVASPVRHLKSDATPRKEELPGRKQYSADTTSIDELLKAYKEKAAEMNDALAALTPPPDFTPEQQRDYYSARKIATVVTETVCDMSGYKPAQWRCHYCNNLHDNPSECARPELGGVWEYISVEQYIAENTQVVSTSLKIE